MEVTLVSLNEDKLVLSRGYLIGPYLPIFGFGALFMIYSLKLYQDDLIVLFVMGLVSCCILEYFTSLLMEKIFHLRWWDYSDRKFHINGRVCLENGIYFGIGAILLIRYIHPWLVKGLLSLSPVFVTILGCVLFIILMIDFVLSTHLTFQLKSDVYHFKMNDSTELLKKEIKKRIQGKSILRKRILTAYPRLKDMHDMISVKELFDKNKKR